MAVRVQEEDFDIRDELSIFRRSGVRAGAIVSFIGLVRDLNDGQDIYSMILEHYPGMTEKVLEKIEQQAHDRWNLVDVLIIHRVGELQPTDQIVLVMVSAVHRRDAFKACEFLMDYLKKYAPLWKKEKTDQGSRWVEARNSDDEAAKCW